jgi:hypothetical protein
MMKTTASANRAASGAIWTNRASGAIWTNAATCGASWILSDGAYGGNCSFEAGAIARQA